MPKETKFERLADVTGRDLDELIFTSECFGWEFYAIEGNVVFFQRETTNSVYRQLVAYETEFTELVRASKYGNPPDRVKKANAFVAFLLFLLLIFPMIIYLVSRNKKYKAYLATSEEYKKRKEDMLERTKAIMATSRSLFFDTHI